MIFINPKKAITINWRGLGNNYTAVGIVISFFIKKKK